MVTMKDFFAHHTFYQDHNMGLVDEHTACLDRFIDYEVARIAGQKGDAG